MSAEKISVNVATQNVLLDKTRTRRGNVLPQDNRIESIALTLSSVKGSLDVVGIQEAYRSSQQHNGEVLARRLGHGSGAWFKHNLPDAANGKGRKDEYIGLFGRMVEDAEPIDLGDSRMAVMTKIAEVAFITAHLRAGIGATNKRHSQAAELLKVIDDFPDAVVFGDFNESPNITTSKARKLLEVDGGFVSVFHKKPQSEKQPVTWPTREYSEVMLGKSSIIRRIIGDRGLRLDDIYVRGNIDVLQADTIDPVYDKDIEPLNLENPEYYKKAPSAPSDHLGLRAELRISVAN